MPLAKPRKGENQTTFVSRCLGDKDMNKEFPDQNQRTAVCFDQWRKAKTKKGESMETEQPIKETQAKEIEQKRDEKGRLIVAENINLIIGATIGEKQHD